MSGRKRLTQSPIREPPLPNPGDSLHDELVRLSVGRALPWLASAAVAIVFAVLEWIRWWGSFPPAPITATIAAAGLLIAPMVVWRRIRRRTERLWLGHLGEVVVGHMLEQLRGDQYEVFHDIPGEGFNIDHVLIGPAGVFVIETKALSKPVGRKNGIEFDGAHVRVNGRVPGRDPIAQVRAASRWIGQMLEPAVGHRPPIRPVLVYPGWWVEPLPPNSDVWVLNPKALRGFLVREPDRLASPEIVALSGVLANYIRARGTSARPAERMAPTPI